MSIFNTDNILEGYIVNNKDIYYNKDKFDSGEINLCFITGHSGSGKTTMAKNMTSGNIEHYELDDVMLNKISFTMENLKEYGDLIYSFFNGIGKKYYFTIEEVKEGKVNSWPNYDELLINDFIKYSISYAKINKSKKFIIEGTWLYMFIEPSKLKEYAVYIKGTSALLSSIRAIKRDTKDNPEAYAKALSIPKILLKRISNFKDTESAINKYRNYFSKLI